MLVKTDLAGNILENPEERKISSELKLHLKVYALRDDVNAVVHAHPPKATAFACARKAMTKPVVSEAMLNLGEVPCAPFAVPGTEELAESIVPYVADHAAVLMANHGAVTWGESMIRAYYRLETAGILRADSDAHRRTPGAGCGSVAGGDGGDTLLQGKIRNQTVGLPWPLNRLRFRS